MILNVDVIGLHHYIVVGSESFSESNYKSVWIVMEFTDADVDCVTNVVERCWDMFGVRNGSDSEYVFVGTVPDGESYLDSE